MEVCSQWIGSPGQGSGIAMQGIIPGKIYVHAPGEGQVPSGTNRYGASFWDSGTGDCISSPDLREASRL